MNGVNFIPCELFQSGKGCRASIKKHSIEWIIFIPCYVEFVDGIPILSAPHNYDHAGRAYVHYSIYPDAECQLEKREREKRGGWAIGREEREAGDVKQLRPHPVGCPSRRLEWDFPKS